MFGDRDREARSDWTRRGKEENSEVSLSTCPARNLLPYRPILLEFSRLVNVSVYILIDEQFVWLFHSGDSSLVAALSPFRHRLVH